MLAVPIVWIEVDGSFYQPLVWHAGREHPEGGPVNTWHSHAVYHIIYITRGTGLFRLGRRSITVYPGMLVLVNPNEWHQFIADDENPFGYYEVTLQLISSSGEPSLMSINRVLEHVWPKTKLLIGDNPILVPQDKDPIICAAFEELVELTKRSGILAEQHLHARLIAFLFMLRELFWDIQRRHEKPENDPDKGYRLEMIDKVCRFIRLCYGQDLTVKDIAGHVHLHPAYFSQVFKAEVGIPPSRYLLNVRMGHARRLLTNTDIPVAEVASHCGFRSASYFSRAFRRATGTSPLKFRQMRQKS